MNAEAFSPTGQQTNVIEHEGSAFVSACPGAGKTRVMVERARRLMSASVLGRGIAFLSFTNAAVSELESRLKAEKVLPSPVYPNFIGTFDSFLWQFLLAPFGVPGCTDRPSLIPDKGEWIIHPFPNTNALPLSCFDPSTGKMDAVAAKKEGYDVAVRKPVLTQRYEAIAKDRFDRAASAGKIDFSDVRAIVSGRLADQEFSSRLGAALAARFMEIIVDEAQDCNPDDLSIITWLRSHGIATKVICDPQQAIYEFRGGITDNLKNFGGTFGEGGQLPLSGNFRSTGAVCSAIVSLRPPNGRANPDQPLGKHRGDPTPVHVFSYGGRSVPSSIGTAYCGLLQELGLNPKDCPVVASTWASAYNAVGQPPPVTSAHSTLRLGKAVTDLHFALSVGGIRAALTNVHRVLLDIRGELNDCTYHEYLLANGLERGQWRGGVLEIARRLEFCPDAQTADQWLAQARAIIEPTLPAGGSSIAQRLRATSDLAGCLGTPTGGAPARSIHSVKGNEFPGVCVVMTVASANGILTFLEDGADATQAPEARRIYVAASRAERLLAIACPKSQSDRLANHLRATGATVVMRQI